MLELCFVAGHHAVQSRVSTRDYVLQTQTGSSLHRSDLAGQCRSRQLTSGQCSAKVDSTNWTSRLCLMICRMHRSGKTSKTDNQTCCLCKQLTHAWPNSKTLSSNMTADISEKVQHQPIYLDNE